jgi:hypothetical protein
MKWAASIATCTLVATIGAACAGARTLTVGPEGADYRDIRSAVAALKEGDRLVIAAGEYRETIDLTDKDWPGEQTTTIEGDSRGGTIIKGSQLVGDWRKTGGDVYSHAGWKTASQQVFVDGRPLQQVGGQVFGGYPGKPVPELENVTVRGGPWPGRVEGDAGSLPPESFYYDAARQTLYIRTAADPNTAKIEASTRTHLLVSDVSRLVVRDLVFEHSNTTAVGRSGAVTVRGSDSTVERIRVRHADGVGVLLNGDRIRMVDSTICHSGQLGLAARGTGLELIGNETSYGNTRGFNWRWVAGGAKFIGGGGLSDSTISGHRSLYNKGSGMWFDTGNAGNRVCQSALAYNEGHGVHFEVSGGGYVGGVLALGNRARGLYLIGSHDLVLRENASIGNGLQAISVVTHGRKSDARTSGNQLLGNLLAWSGGTNDRLATLPKAAEGMLADFNVYVSDSEDGVFASGRKARGGAPALERWRETSGNDAHSLLEIAEAPAGLGADTAGRPPSLADSLRGPIQRLQELHSALTKQYGEPQACGDDAVPWLQAEALLTSRCESEE